MTKIISLALMLCAVNPIAAQQENGAFYIYQNDGHFDGFFYDQVEKISYSKLDTLGVEHDDFVSQEIITADSTYRIMLSAIDSVGFVQPEIKFNPKMRDMRKEGMLAYLTAKDTDALTLTFSSNMPESLRPHEGDVLVDFDFEQGFGGKVKSVNNSGSITVICNPIEGLADVFQQFITVEQLDQNKDGDVISCRTAGMPEATVDNRARLMAPFRASEDTFEGNIFNFGISGHILLLDSSDVSITIDANLNSAVTIKGAYKISTFGSYFMSLTFQNDLNFGLGLTIDAKIGEMKERQTPFKASLPLPAAAPIFELRSVPGLFLKGDAHVKFSADLVKYRKRVWHKLEFNNDWIPSFNFGDAQLPELDEAIDKPWERDASIEFNGTIMAGLHAPVELGINSWLKKWIDASFGIHAFVGPKLSAALNVSLSNAYKDKMSVYNLYKDSKISLQPCAFDFEASAELNTWLSGKKKVTIADGSISLMSDIEVYLFPDFNLTTSTVADNSGYEVPTVTVTPSRNIFWPATIGVGIFQDNEMIDCKLSTEESPRSEAYRPEYTQFSKVWEKKKSYTCQFPSLAPGKYECRPIFRMGIFDIPASPAEPIEIPGAYIKCDKDTIYLDCAGGQETAIVETNCTDFTVVNSNKTNISSEFTKKDAEHYQLTIDMPRYYHWFKPYNAAVTIKGTLNDPSIRYNTAEAAIPVVQKANNRFFPKKGFVSGYLDNSSGSSDIELTFTRVNDTIMHVTITQSFHENSMNEHNTGSINDTEAKLEFDLVNNSSYYSYDLMNITFKRQSYGSWTLPGGTRWTDTKSEASISGYVCPMEIRTDDSYSWKGPRLCLQKKLNMTFTEDFKGNNRLDGPVYETHEQKEREINIILQFEEDEE